MWIISVKTTRVVTYRYPRPPSRCGNSSPGLVGGRHAAARRRSALRYNIEGRRQHHDAVSSCLVKAWWRWKPSTHWWDEEGAGSQHPDAGAFGSRWSGLSEFWPNVTCATRTIMTWHCVCAKKNQTKVIPPFLGEKAFTYCATVAYTLHICCKTSGN